MHLQRKHVWLCNWEGWNSGLRGCLWESSPKAFSVSYKFICNAETLVIFHPENSILFLSFIRGARSFVLEEFGFAFSMDTILIARMKFQQWNRYRLFRNCDNWSWNSYVLIGSFHLVLFVSHTQFYSPIDGWSTIANSNQTWAIFHSIAPLLLRIFTTYVPQEKCFLYLDL